MQAVAESSQRRSPTDTRRLVILLPVLVIAAVLAATAILGFDTGSGSSQEQIDQEVTSLLAGISQDGATLGSPEAQITIHMFADLECPTVRQFVESYLPSIISTWVRTGTVKLKYRSLRTDTAIENTFFAQEGAALAAGRQNKMWNFVLTFVRQQDQMEHKNTLLDQIASQVPELNMDQWNRDRKDLSLFKAIALDVHSAHAQGLRSTPSFVISGSTSMSSTLSDLQSSLQKDLQDLREEASGDVPTLKVS